MAASAYDSGFTALTALAEREEAGDRNEATTRLQLIDELLFKALGWSTDDAILEDHRAREYADYVLHAPRRALIVEAKREGDYFEVPASKGNIEYSIPALIRGNRSLASALSQVSDYCQKRGTPLGAVANGHQIVLFVATRTDGTPPLDGRALVFPSLEFMVENFVILWNSLSRDAVEQKKPLDRLLGREVVEVPPKLASRIHNYPGHKGRNPFQVELQIVSELVLEDVAKQRDLESTFLEECYSKSGALSQYSLISKQLLATRYAALFSTDVPTPPAAVPAVEKGGVSPDILAESLSSRPLLLIGDVGTGKTMFLRHLMKVDAAEIFADAVALYINLGAQATLSRNVRDVVLFAIQEQLRNEHGIDVTNNAFVRGVYNLDIESFSEGVYKKLREVDETAYLKEEMQFLQRKVERTDEHLRRSLEHLSRGRRKQIVVFLDNADQRDHDVQQQVFLVAQEMADRWPATVFVTLRPETFHTSVKTGALSGYHPKAFTISPPRIDRVVELRLAFALKITSGEIPLHTRGTDIKVTFSPMDSVLRAFLYSIERRDDLFELLDNLSGGNVRLALDLVRNFFGSGHVNTEKIVEIFSKERRYLIPLHEFLRAVIYGDGEHYSPTTRTPIQNLFDISSADPREHFLLPVLLGILVNWSARGEDEGFLDLRDVYERLHALGFVADQVDLAIARAHRGKLIETHGRTAPGSEGAPPTAARITSVGAYHVERLAELFVYIDAMIVDTPILDDETRREIGNVEFIAQRLARAEIFVLYLNKCWGEMAEGSEAYFEWPKRSSKLSADIAQIWERNGGRPDDLQHEPPPSEPQEVVRS